MSPFGLSRFVSDEPALDAVLDGIKLFACPHCWRTGALIGHGFLRGYAERSSELVVRGRRVFCSNRGRRTGCGRTFAVNLTVVLGGFLVRTLTLWNFASAVLGGLTRRAAWLRAAAGAFSLSSGYRLWRRLYAAQSGIRARLCMEKAAPASTAREPLSQVLAHIALVVGTDQGDLFSALQNHQQRALLAR